MNLQTTLHFAGITRDAYNALERRWALPFMKRDLLKDSGHDRFTLNHSAALACVRALQDLGLEPRRAISAVDGVFQFIGDIIADRDSFPEGTHQAWLTVYNYPDGTWGWSGGRSDAGTFHSGPVLSKVSINVAVIRDEMAQRWGVPRTENVDE